LAESFAQARMLHEPGRLMSVSISGLFLGASCPGS
jgi:hypothetical protein